MVMVSCVAQVHPPPTVEPPGTVTAVPLDIVCAGPYPQDPVQLSVVGITRGHLHLRAQYAGGCREHRFHACTDGLMTGFLPTAWIRVFHDAQDDYCEALITRDLYIDLTPLRREYWRLYGMLSGTIRIVLWPEGRDLLYRF